MVKADLISTPFMDFLMVEIINKEDPVNTIWGYVLGVGVKPRAVQPVKGNFPSIDDLTQIRDSHPEFPIEGFYMPHVGEVAGRKLSNFDDSLIDDLSKKVEGKYSDLRNDFLTEVWLQTIKQHGKNALTYDKDHGVLVNREGDKIRLADNSGGANCGHGDFEIKTYRILSQTPSHSKSSIYPVSTLELELIGSKVGQGIYDFGKEFSK